MDAGITPTRLPSPGNERLSVTLSRSKDFTSPVFSGQPTHLLYRMRDPEAPLLLSPLHNLHPHHTGSGLQTDRDRGLLPPTQHNGLRPPFGDHAASAILGASSVHT